MLRRAVYSAARNIMELIEQLERTRDETLSFYRLDEADLARTYAPGKWPIRFILLHLADSETVLYDRVRRILSEPRQVLWVYDQDAFARGLDYAQVPLDIYRDIYATKRSFILPANTTNRRVTSSSCTA
jgi:hypothetical protein